MSKFFKNWESLTVDPFILQCIRGYQIPFIQAPDPALGKSNLQKFQSLEEVNQVIKSLLNKGAIEPCGFEEGQFLSPYFLVPKPDGSFRFILNLKCLNNYVSTAHFKLEDIRTATKLITPNSYMLSLDLKDAYFLVPVHESYRKYLKFKSEGTLYRFTCLPFGLSSSPFVFTKVLKPVINFLRKKGFLSVIYLDDILCIADSYEECLRNARYTIELLESLGFVINDKKSDLIPAKLCKFLGFLIDSSKGLLLLTEQKRRNLTALLTQFLRQDSCKIMEFARVLGKLVAACPAVEYGWLYTKIMESEKLKALDDAQGNYKKVMHLSRAVKKDIEWWIRNIPVAHKSFRLADFRTVIYTDASDSGWGATDGVRSTHGTWSDSQYAWSINYKELYAVKLALESLASDTADSHILLRVDNKTAISYINKMGGVRFEKFNSLAREIWQSAEKRKNFLKASYITSKENTQADALSRLSTLDTEWELCNEAFEQIIDSFGSPEVDIFASALNAKCKKFFSWLPEPQALQVDAFKVSWSNIFFYAFPPLHTNLKNPTKGLKGPGNWHNSSPRLGQSTVVPTF